MQDWVEFSDNEHVRLGARLRSYLAGWQLQKHKEVNGFQMSKPVCSQASKHRKEARIRNIPGGFKRAKTRAAVNSASEAGMKVSAASQRGDAGNRAAAGYNSAAINGR
jgi:hypothetical protein